MITRLFQQKSKPLHNKKKKKKKFKRRRHPTTNSKHDTDKQDTDAASGLFNARRFIDHEAVLSGTDSGDDSEQSDEQLSGSFINDGGYTQNDADDTGLGMYFGINR